MRLSNRMKLFRCDHCGHTIYFENVSCTNCGHRLGFIPEIDRLESDADHVMRSAMAKLFREEDDAKQLLKMKEIYQLLESVTDRCQDVANLIEGIVIENG